MHTMRSSRRHVVPRLYANRATWYHPLARAGQPDVSCRRKRAHTRFASKGKPVLPDDAIRTRGSDTGSGSLARYLSNFPLGISRLKVIPVHEDRRQAL
jgi:hypothetical protein